MTKERKKAERGLEWWPVPESNQGHKDFQSSALPTELTGLQRGGVDLGWSDRFLQEENVKLESG